MGCMELRTASAPHILDEGRVAIVCYGHTDTSGTPSKRQSLVQLDVGKALWNHDLCIRTDTVIVNGR